MAKTDKTNVEAAQWNKNFQQHNQELVLLEAMAEVLGLTTEHCLIIDAIMRRQQ